MSPTGKLFRFIRACDAILGLGFPGGQGAALLVLACPPVLYGLWCGRMFFVVLVRSLVLLVCCRVFQVRSGVFWRGSGATRVRGWVVSLPRTPCCQWSSLACFVLHLAKHAPGVSWRVHSCLFVLIFVVSWPRALGLGGPAGGFMASPPRLGWSRRWVLACFFLVSNVFSRVSGVFHRPNSRKFVLILVTWCFLVSPCESL